MAYHAVRVAPIVIGEAEVRRVVRRGRRRGWVVESMLQRREGGVNGLLRMDDGLELTRIPSPGHQPQPSVPKDSYPSPACSTPA